MLINKYNFLVAQFAWNRNDLIFMIVVVGRDIDCRIINGVRVLNRGLAMTFSLDIIFLVVSILDCEEISSFFRGSSANVKYFAKPFTTLAVGSMWCRAVFQVHYKCLCEKLKCDAIARTGWSE